MITDEYPWGTNDEYPCESIDNDDRGLLNAWHMMNFEYPPCPECGEEGMCIHAYGSTPEGE